LAQSRRALVQQFVAGIAEREMNLRSKVVNSCEALLLSVMAASQLGLLIVTVDALTEGRASGNFDHPEARAHERVLETIVVRG
jgi:hypothetical protein